MKRIYYLLFLTVFFACSQGSKYEKTIADYVQTDSHGTKYDMKFKALEISETARMTVADSITFIQKAFDGDKTKKIADFEGYLRQNEESLEKEKNNKIKLKTLIDMFEKNIEKDKQVIDSLKTATPEDIKKYENRKPDELLAIIVRCKYSIVPPVINTRAEETFDFTLSPDGQKCYGQKRIK